MILIFGITVNKVVAGWVFELEIIINHDYQIGAMLHLTLRDND